MTGEVVLHWLRKRGMKPLSQKPTAGRISVLTGHTVCPIDTQETECNTPATALDHFLGQGVSREPLIAEARVCFPFRLTV